MSVMPPERNDAGYPGWTLIGPGLASASGLFLLTMVFSGPDGVPPIQLELGYSGTQFLLTAVVAYLVAAAVAFPLGMLVGGRSLLAAILPAIGLMLIGAALTAFASGPAILLAMRVLTGLGAGAAIGATAATLRRVRGQRIIPTAVVGAVCFLAAIVAPFFSQLVSMRLSFRTAFLSQVPLLFGVLILNVILGIVLYVTTRRPAQPTAYVPSTTRR